MTTRGITAIIIMAVIFMALGIPVYIWASKQNDSQGKIFSNKEVVLASALVMISVIAIYAMSTSIVKI